MRQRIEPQIALLVAIADIDHHFAPERIDDHRRHHEARVGRTARARQAARALRAARPRSTPASPPRRSRRAPRRFAPARGVPSSPSHQPSAEQQVQPRIDDVERVAVEPALGKRHQQADAVAVGEVHEHVQQHADVRQQQQICDGTTRSPRRRLAGPVAIVQRASRRSARSAACSCASTPCVQPRRNDIASVLVANTPTSMSGRL